MPSEEPTSSGPPAFFWIIIGCAVLIAIAVVVVITFIPVHNVVNVIK